MHQDGLRIGLLIAGLAAASGAGMPGQAQFVERTPAVLAATRLAEGAAADYDGDGDVDLCGSVGYLAPAPSLRFLRNDGGERFVDVTASHLPPQPAYGLVVMRTTALDIDADGDMDLLITTFGSATLLWRNNGNGTFVDVSANLPPNPGGYEDVVVADLDGDLDLDVFAAGSALWNSSNAVWVNQGNGTFTAANPVPGNMSTHAAVADLDQDGDPDLLLGTWNALRVWRNDGALVFTDVTATVAPGLPTQTVRWIVAGDLDGDLVPEVVLGYQSSYGDLVLRLVGGVLQTAGMLPGTSSAGGGAMRAFDIDADGDLDVVRAEGGGMLTLAVNDGTGTLTLSPSRLVPVPTLGPFLIDADVDDDGDVDLVLGDVFHPTVVFVNRHRDLEPGQPAIGQPWDISIWSEPGYATLHHAVRVAIALAPLPQPLAVPAFGDLRIDLGPGYVFFNGIVLAGVGVHTFTLAVPPLPALVGVPLHVQGLAEQARAPAHFTAYFPVVVL